MNNVAKGIWKKGKLYYCKVRQRGIGQRWHVLRSESLDDAIIQKGVDQGLAKLGKLNTNISNELSPQTNDGTRSTKPTRNPGTAKALTPVRNCGISDLLILWAKSGYPSKKFVPAQESKIKELRRMVKNLENFFGNLTVDELAIVHCVQYHTWRVERTNKAKAANVTGSRSAECELAALSSCLNWSALCGHIRTNPISNNRPRFVCESDIHHCTEFMPADDEEFHTLAKEFFKSPQSEVLGWQTLLEGLTGCRTSEVIKMMIHTNHKAPKEKDRVGAFNEKCLWINRLKGGCEPWVVMHRPLHDALVECRHWVRHRYPYSKYYLPGREGIMPVGKNSLSHGLTRICNKLGLPNRTSHGLRAYYVRVLRSQGISDSEISKRLGHKSGVQLVEKVYGKAEPGFAGERELDFLPANGVPAWQVMSNTLKTWKLTQNESPSESTGGRKWSGWRDSNSRPPDPQSGALTRLRYIPNPVRAS